MSVLLAHRANLPTLRHNDADELLSHIARQTRFLEHCLQGLLDAQAEALLAGSGTLQSHDSPRRRFATSPAFRSNSVVPAASPAQRPSARRNNSVSDIRVGILKSMRELLKLREDERQILSYQVQEREEALLRVDEFLGKKANIEEAISAVGDEVENRRLKELRNDARDLQADIEDLESKLSGMKSKHREMMNEIARLEDSVDAHLSSYKAALSLVESDIQSFLRNPPLGALSSSGAQATFYALKPNRRTLEMAQEHWQSEEQALRTRRDDVDAEILALHDGIPLWKQVITDVAGFENRLKAEIELLRKERLQGLSSNEESRVNIAGDEKRFQLILGDLDQTTHRVAERLRMAKEREWNLLVCCIAVEVDALRTARSLFLSTFDGLENNSLSSPRGEPLLQGRPGDHSALYSTFSPAERSEHTEPTEHTETSETSSAASGLNSSLNRSAPATPSGELDPTWLLPEV